jgi:hypothetical protein
VDPKPRRPRIILKLIFTNWDGGIGWVVLAQDKRWWAVVDVAMNIYVP